MAKISTLLAAGTAVLAGLFPSAVLAAPSIHHPVGRIAAPELDPSSAAAVVFLLVGVALLAHRRSARV
jgi:hypothetical protein